MKQKLRDYAYETEMKKHIDKMETVLDGFTSVSSLTDNDYLTIERALQILIESFIGLCRYTLKIEYKIKTHKSIDALSTLHQKKVFNALEYEGLKHTIGYRNILVHDYLNLNPEVTKAILEKREYKDVIGAQEKLLSLISK